MRFNVGDLLLKIKGIFTTLTHAMPDLAKAEKSTSSSSPPVFTSVSVTFEDGQEKLVRVAAVQDTGDKPFCSNFILFVEMVIGKHFCLNFSSPVSVDRGVLMAAVPADCTDSREFRDFFKNFTTPILLLIQNTAKSTSA